MPVIREIELRPHIGHTTSGREVVFAQDQIFLNGMRVGYIGHQTNDVICLLRPADTDTVMEIRRVVEEKFGGKPKRVTWATPISDENHERE